MGYAVWATGLGGISVRDGGGNSARDAVFRGGLRRDVLRVHFGAERRGFAPELRAVYAAIEQPATPANPGVENRGNNFAAAFPAGHLAGRHRRKSRRKIVSSIFNTWIRRRGRLLD